MFEAFLIKPFLALILVVCSCCFLGVFMLWKKISYCGDALSHAALLGISLGTIFKINQFYAVTFFAIFFASAIWLMSQNRFFSKDSLIMIFSYASVATALLINGSHSHELDLDSYIFGEISAVSANEIWMIFAAAIAVAIFSIFAFRKILVSTLSPDLARIDGINPEFWDLIFLIIFSVVIALGIHVVGLLLLMSLLILPAAIARIFSINPKQMLVKSLLIGILVCAISFKAAGHYETEISALMILVFSAIFFLSLLIKKFSANAKF